MADEPSLPRLQAVSWDERSQSFSNNPRKRGRVFRAGSATSLKYNSSDPAVFSSDDDPGLDNYVEGRRKKRYVGSWFQQQPTSSDSTFSDNFSAPRTKRVLERKFDSGVYLGSDGTDGSDAEILELPVRSKLPQLDRRPVVAAVSEAERIAREKIQACIENGNETVDCWSLGLEELSNETIRPLSELSCIPTVAKDVAFEQKDPELKVYLAMNRLRSVPGALFDLTHLTTLSLRGNKLTELPPAIAKLSNLRDLNVSQNRLRHVPAELVDLLRKKDGLQALLLHPNPFFQPNQPFTVEDGAANRPESFVSRHIMSRTMGRSAIQISDAMGQVLSDFKLPDGAASLKLGVAQGDEMSATKPSRVPALVEIALRSCYSTAELSELRHYIPEGLLHIQELLDGASRQKDMGGLCCSCCRKTIIVPVLEWVEWRELSTCEKGDGSGTVIRPLSKLEDERAVPFLHRACSWKCGPRH